MAKLGTAFVDVQPDFSAFDRLVARKLSSSFKGEGENAGREFSGGFKRNVKVDVDRSAFTSFTDAAKGLLDTLGGSGGGGLGGATTRLSAGFLSFGSSLGPVVALLGALAVTVGVSLVGAFAALVASLAAAAAGAAALGVAFAAVLGPAAGLAVAVGARLAKVFEALKAQDAAADDVGRKTAAGSAAAAAATQALEAAERSRSEAVRQLGLATTAAYREMADAAERASDAIRGVERAELSLDESKLGTERARLELQKFREEAGATDKAFGAIFTKFTDVSVDTSGLKKAIENANAASGGKLDASQELELRQKVLDVRDARLREKEATDGVSDAQREATRAQQDNNKFKREGIRASEQYRGALRGVESATLAVAAAQRQGDAGAAQEKALQLTGRLSKSENAFLESLKQVRKELRGAFGPATDAVFGGLNRALLRVPNLINPLRGAFKRLGEAVGSAFDRISGDLVKPETVASFRRFTDTAARLAGPITDGLLSLFHIFLNIANAALPHLVSGTKSVAGQLKKWDVGTSNSKKMSKTIGTLVGHLKTWLGVGAAIADVFLAFLEDAAGPGRSLADSIKGVANRTAEWLRSTDGREEMKRFFKDAIAFTKDFVGFMAQLIKFTVEFGQKGAQVFHKVSDLVGGSKNLANGLVFALGTLATLKFAGGVVSGIRSIRRGLLLAKGATNAWTLSVIRGQLSLVATRVGLIAAAAASRAFAAAQLLVNIALRANPIGLIVTALVALGVGLVVAYKHSQTFRNVVTGAFDSVKTVATGAIRLILGAFDKLLGGFSSIGRGLSHLPLIGDKFKGGADAIDHARERVRAFADSLKDVAKIKNLKVTINAAISPDLARLLRNIDNPNVSSKIRKTPPVPGLHRAAGGVIPGSHNRDDVPILATPGEFMVRKFIVGRVGMGVMADINAGKLDPRVGYLAGQRPSMTVQPARGPRFATGGLVGAAAGASTGTTIVHHNNFTVPGGGSPDPLNLSVQLARLSERRSGGDPGNW